MIIHQTRFSSTLKTTFRPVEKSRTEGKALKIKEKNLSILSTV